MLNKISNGIWSFLPNTPKKITTQDVFTIDEGLSQTVNLRSRICVHDDSKDVLHQMCILFSGKSYIRPSCHENVDESFTIIIGAGKYVFFDNQGNYTSDIRLKANAKYIPFYVKVPGNLFHTLIPYSPKILAIESCVGPYEKDRTKFPSWSEDLKTQIKFDEFNNKNTYLPVSSLKNQPALVLKKSELITISIGNSDAPIFMSFNEIKRLISEFKIQSTFRIVINAFNNQPFEESFIIFQDLNDIQEVDFMKNIHSLLCISGEARLDLINNDSFYLKEYSNLENTPFFYDLKDQIFRIEGKSRTILKIVSKILI